MTQSVRTIELVKVISALIHVLCMIHVEKMPSVILEVIDQFVDVLMDGQEIHTLNVTHVGFEYLRLFYLFCNLFLLFS